MAVPDNENVERIMLLAIQLIPESWNRLPEDFEIKPTFRQLDGTPLASTIHLQGLIMSVMYKIIPRLAKVDVLLI